MSNIQKYIDQEGLHNTEGERGLKNLEQLVEAIGYKRHGFRYGNPIEVFLQDNPGCIEAIQQWIIDARVSEWDVEIEDHLNEDDEDEDEVDEDEEGGGYGEANS